MSGALPPAATALSEAAERGDKLAAWRAGGELLAWLADLSHPISPGAARMLVWSSAARHRWFELAEVLAGAIAARAVHRAGGDAMPRLDGSGATYQANEGIWIGAIREAVAAR